MQVTKINYYSLAILCGQNAQGRKVAGYTLPHRRFADGLLISNRVAPLSGYKGFRK